MNGNDKNTPTLRTELASPPGSDVDFAAVLAGHDGIYRLGFASMQVDGMPEEFDVGTVHVQHLTGPVKTQRTTVIQLPGLQPTFVKWIEYPLVGRNRPMTIYSLRVTVPDIPGLLNTWRDEVLAAVGFLSMVLDERLAQDLVLEDLLVLPPEGDAEPVYVDVRRGIRTFEPSNPWLERFTGELARYQRQERSHELRTASRWYLRGAMTGPTADGFLMLWIALESLVPLPARGKGSNQVRDLEDALRRADPKLDPKDAIHAILGRLSGLQADIVHKGRETGRDDQGGLLHR